MRFLAIVLAFALAPLTARAQSQIAVPDIAFRGDFSAEVAALISDMVRQEAFKRLSGAAWQLVPKDRLHVVASTPGLQDQCAKGCALTLAREVGAQLVLEGSGHSLGKRLILQLNLLDVASGALRGSETLQAPDAEGLVDALPATCARLFEPLAAPAATAPTATAPSAGRNEAAAPGQRPDAPTAGSGAAPVLEPARVRNSGAASASKDAPVPGHGAAENLDEEDLDDAAAQARAVDPRKLEARLTRSSYGSVALLYPLGVSLEVGRWRYRNWQFSAATGYLVELGGLSDLEDPDDSFAAGFGFAGIGYKVHLDVEAAHEVGAILYPLSFGYWAIEHTFDSPDGEQGTTPGEGSSTALFMPYYRHHFEGTRLAVEVSLRVPLYWSGRNDLDQPFQGRPLILLGAGAAY